MGLLLNEAAGQRVVLRAEHVIGRDSRRADTHLDDPEVSMLHATLRWRDGAWSLTDHSRNGTLQDGRVVPRGSWTALSVGRRLRFGPSARGSFVVLDLSPPVTTLVPADPARPLIELRSNNLLPDADAPELSIYRAAPDRWILDRDGAEEVLADGQRLDIARCEYRLVIVSAIDDTVGAARALEAERLELVFRLSRDEERVHLQASYADRQLDLGERTHHYCLVTLARRRIADRAAGRAPAAQGWLACAELAKQLRIDPQHLNTLIFRARNQLMAALPDHASPATIVERRRGELRLAELTCTILGGAQPDARYDPLTPPHPALADYALQEG